MRLVDWFSRCQSFVVNDADELFEIGKIDSQTNGTRRMTSLTSPTRQF